MGTVTERRGGRLAFAVLGWAVLAALLVGAFLAALGALNQTVYGAGAFVERYLSAVARDDLAAAVATPGVDVGADRLAELGLPAGTSRAMLRSGVIDEHPDDVQIVADVAEPDGTHTVGVTYSVGTSILRTDFSVRPIEALYGVLNRWAFATSPLAVVDVTVRHGAVFQVGGLSLDARAAKTGDALAAFTQTAPYLVAAPAGYTFGAKSTLIAALDESHVAEPSTRGSVAIDLQPTPAFVERVQQQVNTFLTEECAAQPVLQPAGCPFGARIEDRVLDEPSWSVLTTPTVTLTAGDDAFVMPPTAGTAHLSVLVQSLFDGSTEQLEEDHPFTLALSAVIRPDGTVAVQLE